MKFAKMTACKYLGGSMRSKKVSLLIMSGKEEDVRALIELGRKLGVPVKKPGKYVKVSSTVHEKTWAEFRRLTDELGYPVQGALTEALDCWIEMRSQKK
jgi:hypothetical protein